MKINRPVIDLAQFERKKVYPPNHVDCLWVNKKWNWQSTTEGNSINTVFREKKQTRNACGHLFLIYCWLWNLIEIMHFYYCAFHLGDIFRIYQGLFWSGSTIVIVIWCSVCFKNHRKRFDWMFDEANSTLVVHFPNLKWLKAIVVSLRLADQGNFISKLLSFLLILWMILLSNIKFKWNMMPQCTMYTRYPIQSIIFGYIENCKKACKYIYIYILFKHTKLFEKKKHYYAWLTWNRWVTCDRFPWHRFLNPLCVYIYNMLV